MPIGWPPRSLYEASGKAARVFMDFRYRTRESWSCERRVIGKAEHLAKGENPRFIIASLTDAERSQSLGDGRPEWAMITFLPDALDPWHFVDA